MPKKWKNGNRYYPCVSRGQHHPINLTVNLVDLFWAGVAIEGYITNNSCITGIYHTRMKRVLNEIHRASNEGWDAQYEGDVPYPEERDKEMKLNELRENMLLDIIRNRQTKGLSMVEAAKAAGISQPNWSRIENGVQHATLDTLIDMAKAVGLEVSIAYE
tara:strand:+ start:268 stop:747 length:480 start_codon:yes stop_codon:yes gene_type:complete